MAKVGGNFDEIRHVRQNDQDDVDHYRPPWGKKPFPWRTISAAILLFTLGTILLVRGVNEVTYYDGERGRSMIILGSICFMPGSYASYLLWGAYRRWPGYKWNHVPSYDD